MEISIIIPSYKPKEYFWKCLDSIKDQTFDKALFEIIIIINGCNEPYYSEINNYINTHLVRYNVNIIQTDIGGVSNARNIGLDSARGQYITFIDDDDYISPPYLQELYDIVAQGVLPLSNFIAFNDGTNKEQPHYISNLYEKKGHKNHLHILQVRPYFSSPVAKLIPIKVIGETKFNTKFQNGEDGLFMLQISNTIEKIKFTSNKATYYRRYRENSLTSIKKKKKEKAVNSILLIWNYILTYFKKPFEYNIIFTITRVLAEIKSLL